MPCSPGKIRRAAGTARGGYAPDAEIHFERIAVTAAQILEYNLPTKPTKTTDSRSASFTGESIEVDAIPPSTLRALARAAIESRLDTDQLAVTVDAERQDVATLTRWAADHEDDDE